MLAYAEDHIDGEESDRGVEVLEFEELDEEEQQLAAGLPSLPKASSKVEILFFIRYQLTFL